MSTAWGDALNLCRRCGEKTRPSDRYALKLSGPPFEVYLCSACGSGAHGGVQRAGNAPFVRGRANMESA